MAEAKTKPTGKSVHEFIAAVPSETRRREAKTVMTIMRRVTGQPPKMWGPSIIGYGSHHYRYASGREGDMPIAGFSPRKAELVVYLMSGTKRQKALLARLGPHRTGVACLYIRSLASVDLDVLEALVRESAATLKVAD